MWLLYQDIELRNLNSGKIKLEICQDILQNQQIELRFSKSGPGNLIITQVSLCILLCSYFAVHWSDLHFVLKFYLLKWEFLRLPVEKENILGGLCWIQTTFSKVDWRVLVKKKKNKKDTPDLNWMLVTSNSALFIDYSGIKFKHKNIVHSIYRLGKILIQKNKAWYFNFNISTCILGNKMLLTGCVFHCHVHILLTFLLLCLVLDPKTSAGSHLPEIHL